MREQRATQLEESLANLLRFLRRMLFQPSTDSAGQEFEFRDELVAGETYRVTAKIAEVYEKTGRSGPLGVIVREVEL